MARRHLKAPHNVSMIAHRDLIYTMQYVYCVLLVNIALELAKSLRPLVKIVPSVLQLHHEQRIASHVDQESIKMKMQQPVMAARYVVKEKLLCLTKYPVEVVYLVHIKISLRPQNMVVNIARQGKSIKISVYLASFVTQDTNLSRPILLVKFVLQGRLNHTIM